MVRHFSSGLAAVLCGLAGVVASAAEEPQSESDLFHPPQRLVADGKVIDTGDAWGHSSPAIVDFNRDGLPDLVVGSFDGKFRLFRNTGTLERPEYKAEGVIEAGGNPAQVHIYCCIGGQPRFHDLNGDGETDFLANSYDPGHAHLFLGLGDGKYAAAEVLTDSAGVPVRSSPVQRQNYESFGSFYEAVDWDHDGDLDLLIGCFTGELKLRLNTGSATSPQWATENVVVEAAGRPIKVKAHLCPVVADWDQDGRWDIVAGSDDGSVVWFRNVGTADHPEFAAAEPLVPAHEGSGYNLLAWEDAEIWPGIRSQVEVTDWNGDGKPDLLLGDFCTTFDFRPDLTAEDQQKIRDLFAAATDDSLSKKMDAMREDFAKRYPGDAIFSDEADREWTKAYTEFRSSPEFQQAEERDRQLGRSIRPYLKKSRGGGDRTFDLAVARGYVWLYLRR